MGIRLSDIAVEALRSAVKMGFPIEFKAIASNVLLIRRGRAAGVVYLRRLDSDDGYYVAGYPDPYSVWGVKLALVRSGDPAGVEVYPHMVPILCGYYPHMFSTFEVDVWRRRLEFIDKLRPSDSVPAALAPYKVLGCRILVLPETGDYAAERDDVILAWYNAVTGKLDDATEYILKAGLFKPGLLDGGE